MNNPPWSRLLALLLALPLAVSLLFGIALATASTAAAKPPAPVAPGRPMPPIPTPRVVVKGDPLRQVTKRQAAVARAVQSINAHATGPKRKVLDYRLAKRWDRGEVSVRRQFAAVWLFWGKDIKHISKAELKVVRAYVKTYFAKVNPPRRCKGKSGFESYGGGAWNLFLNSCQTTVIKVSMAVAGAVAGVVAVKVPPAAPTALATGALLEIGAAAIDGLQDFSPTSSIFVMRRVVGPVRANVQVFTVMPQ